MKSLYITTLLALSMFTGAQQKKSDLLGARNAKSSDGLVCVWVNNEPVFHLYQDATNPRIADTYPIVAGENNVEIKYCLPGKKYTGDDSVAPTVFYSNGDVEEEIKLQILDGRSTYHGVFTAAQGYSLPAPARMAPLKDEQIALLRNWVRKYLDAVVNKEARFVDLIVDSVIAEQYDNYYKRMRDGMVITKQMRPEEYNVCIGKNLIYIFGSGVLMEWKREDVVVSLEGYLFASTADGFYLQRGGGQWIKLKLDISR